MALFSRTPETVTEVFDNGSNFIARLGAIENPQEEKKKPRTPKPLATIIKAIEDDPDLNPGIRMLELRDEFTKTQRRLIGISNYPPARMAFEDRLDAVWRSRTADRAAVREADEIIIGGGVHAAIYASVRKAKGAPKPIVLEAKRVGGAFACSRMPSFFLNSRNRPGNLSVPGQPGALNVIPGAPIQPSDLSNEEYQRNTDLAFCVRVALAMTADVRYAKVTATESNENDHFNRRYSITTEDGAVYYTDRIIIATGIGQRRRISRLQNGTELPPRAFYFDDFMSKAGDEAFPLRGVKTVAVIGSGDSSRVAVEALVGQGPGGRWGSASLDYVERIDWYGPEQNSREDWISCNRSRYQGLGRLLPRAGSNRFDGEQRLRTIDARPDRIEAGYECVLVNGVPYDLVVVANGLQTRSRALTNRASGSSFSFNGGYLLSGYDYFEQPGSMGRKLGIKASNDEEVYLIGPCADLPVDSTYQEGPVSVGENTASIWRYAPLTASMAEALPIVDNEDDDDDDDVNPFVVEKKENVLSKTYLGDDSIGQPINIGDIVRVESPSSTSSVKDRRGVVVGPGGLFEGIVCVDFGLDNEGDRIGGGYELPARFDDDKQYWGLTANKYRVVEFGLNGGINKR